MKLETAAGAKVMERRWTFRQWEASFNQLKEISADAFKRLTEDLPKLHNDIIGTL
jgi:hypothetical protein